MELPVNFNLSGRWNVISGENCVRDRGEVIKYYAAKVLVICGGSGARKSGALEDFEALFDSCGIDYRIYEGAGENPPFDGCVSVAEQFASFAPDGVLGIGGGSALDMAKTVAVMCANPGITAEQIYAKNLPNAPLPIFACGTTAGTGSEVTSYAVLTRNVDGIESKIGYGSEYIVPAISFCDPRYTATMPRKTTLTTAIDAISQACEACFHKKTGIVARMFARQALSMLWPRFCKAAGGGELDARDREELLYGSVLAGFAIEFTGTCLPHGAGYVFTTAFGAEHGFACGYLTCDFLRLQQTRYPDEVARLLETMGLSDLDEMEKVIYSVLPCIRKDTDTLAVLCREGERSHHLYSSLVPSSPEGIRAIYTRVLERLERRGEIH